jgi:hypothetical protein
MCYYCLAVAMLIKFKANKMCKEQLRLSQQFNSKKNDYINTEAYPLDQRTLGDEVSIRILLISIAIACITVAKKVEWSQGL